MPRNDAAVAADSFAGNGSWGEAAAPQSALAALSRASQGTRFYAAARLRGRTHYAAVMFAAPAWRHSLAG